MDDRFYITHWHMRCFVHDRPVSYQVKSHLGGDVYRNACSQSCAERQKAELEKAWADREETQQ